MPTTGRDDCRAANGPPTITSRLSTPAGSTPRWSWRREFHGLVHRLQNAFWQLGGVPKRASHRQPLGGIRQHRARCSGGSTRPGTAPFAAIMARSPHATTAALPTRMARSRAGTAIRDTARSGLDSYGDRATSPTLEDYRTFVAHAVGRQNRGIAMALRVEAHNLLPLPPRRSCDYVRSNGHVTSSSASACARFYTVPSRLIGHRLKARIFDDRIELLLAGGERHYTRRCHAGERPKVGRGPRTHVVNYRSRHPQPPPEPGALAGLVYRDQLSPLARSIVRAGTLIERCHSALRCRPPHGRTAVAGASIRLAEADLAARPDDPPRCRRMPDLQDLQARFQRPRRRPTMCPVDIPPTAYL